MLAGQIRCQTAGSIELTENESSRVCNLRERYWLYVLYNCGTPNPPLLRVRNPFYDLIATAQGSVIIGEEEIFVGAVREPPG